MLKAKPVQIKTLDGRSLTLGFDELVSPQTIRCVEGEGMPCEKKDQSEGKPMALLSLADRPKGDLFVRFDIQFPNFSFDQKNQIVAALRANEADLE